ncbi:hypothetical protein GGI21_006263, partial [Coemansia aciculifera]
EPIGAEERKTANKYKRKNETKRRELKERTQAKKNERKMLLAASSVQLDTNALEHEATAEEERSYQEDLAKIRDMDRRAGVDTMGLEAGSKPSSKKAKRAEKKVQKSAGSNDIPELVPITEPVAISNPGNGSEDGAWVVRSKGSVAASAAQKRRREAESLMPLEESGELFVVKDKPKATSDGAGIANGASKAKGVLSTPPSKQVASESGERSSEKKRLTWALERNSTKRFLKRVPMLPSPTQATSTPDSDLKPALRKVSAYLDVLPAAQSPLKALKAKADRRVSVNGHASTPVRGAKKPKQRR